MASMAGWSARTRVGGIFRGAASVTGRRLACASATSTPGRPAPSARTRASVTSPMAGAASAMIARAGSSPSGSSSTNAPPTGISCMQAINRPGVPVNA